MFCPSCGNQIDDQAVFCKYCGAKIQAGQPVNPVNQPNPSDNVVEFTVPPENQINGTERIYAQTQPQPVQPQPQPIQPQPKAKKGGAVLALIFGIIGAAIFLFAYILGFLTTPLMEVFGIRYHEDIITFIAISSIIRFITYNTGLIFSFVGTLVGLITVIKTAKVKSVNPEASKVLPLAIVALAISALFLLLGFINSTRIFVNFIQNRMMYMDVFNL